MPRKPKQEQLLSSKNSVTGNLELHVTGNLLPCSTYNRILDAMKENRDDLSCTSKPAKCTVRLSGTAG